MTIEHAESILRSIKELKTPLPRPAAGREHTGDRWPVFLIPTEDDIESYLWGNHDAEDYFSKIDSAEELTDDFRLYLWDGART